MGVGLPVGLDKSHPRVPKELADVITGLFEQEESREWRDRKRPEMGK